jgi:hypothetical protein
MVDRSVRDFKSVKAHRCLSCHRSKRTWPDSPCTAGLMVGHLCTFPDPFKVAWRRDSFRPFDVVKHSARVGYNNRQSPGSPFIVPMDGHATFSRSMPFKDHLVGGAGCGALATYPAFPSSRFRARPFFKDHRFNLWRSVGLGSSEAIHGFKLPKGSAG